MTQMLCLTVRFLQPYFHGRADGDEPEWPPSPLRLFQALVAAAGARWNERTHLTQAAQALQWLERQPAPLVVAPVGVPASSKYRLYVPDNVGDKVASSWSRGRSADIAGYRTEKDVRPVHLGGDATCYLYPIKDSDAAFPDHRDTLTAAARSITHLGWGIDMVAGDATVITTEEAARLPGERWRPVDDTSANGCRVPCEGTLDALVAKHQAFLNRLGTNGFSPVPPLGRFRVVGYRRASESVQRPYATFQILKPDGSGFRAFDAPRRTRDVAAWVRHAVAAVCQGWPFEDIGAFVHGHGPNGAPLKGPDADRRFMYLPLPTINHALRRVESIRRVLVVAPPGCQDRRDWIRRRLPGQDLVTTDGEIVGVLNLQPTPDWVLRQYTSPARAWSTVTPVVWPGHDDHDPRKAEGILRKAFVQAGLSPELVAAIEELEWRPVGFRAGVDLANRYRAPDKVKGRQYHVRVRFPHPVPGPLAVGAGRYRGLGLFASEP